MLKKVSIIIPVFNEEKLIVKTIESVIGADSLGLHKEIIIVDDGSTDDTVKNVKAQMTHDKLDNKTTSFIFIELKKNQGKGAALKAGFKKATGDIFMVQDADSEYNVHDYPSLLTPFLKENALVVYGSRNKKRENFHNRYSYLIYYWGGLVLTWIINLLFGLHLTDQAAGYKLFSNKVKSLLLQPKENRFSYEVAITALLAQNRHTFVEVPIHYKPRTMKEGKKISAIDFIASVFVAVKYAVGG